MILKGRHVDVQRVVESLNLIVQAETNHEILVDCPFHNDDGNNLSISREKGAYHCWVCYPSDRRAGGNLVHLVSILRSITYDESVELILRESSVVSGVQLLADVRGMLHRPSKRRARQPIWNEVDRYYNPRHYYWRKTRKIDSWTAAKFMLGFDEKKNQAIIPITEDGVPTGLIRRRLSKVGNRYIYPSKEEGFFRNEHLFGLDRCTGNGLYIVEGPVDCLKVHQAGYNGVAVLGAYLSDTQSRRLLEYDPDYLVLMTDEDMGGELLSTHIYENFPLRHMYAVTLPNGRKDPGECTTWEIWEAIEHKISLLTLNLPHVQQGLHERTSKA